MGLPIVVVASGGLPVTEAANGIGLPVTPAASGFAVPVTLVANGLPVVGSGSSSTNSLLAGTGSRLLSDTGSAILIQ
jgi:hypothetical protein